MTAWSGTSTCSRRTTPLTKPIGRGCPRTLGDALEALEACAAFREAFGDAFLDYYLRLKRAELDRFQRWCEDNGDDGGDVTPWEQNEYYDFF